MKKLWEGRLDSKKDAIVDALNASIDFDKRLYAEDIEGSKAHANMLNLIGVLDADETEKITNGLSEIKVTIERGEMEFSHALEDIHTHIETALREKIGDVGGKLHTARSRNDQVNTDVRLYVRKAGKHIREELLAFADTLLQMAKKHKETVMPGYTHLQPAQPMVFAHLLLAYFFMLRRDVTRLDDCLARVNTLTLGSGAFAGVNYALDRHAVKQELGFDGVSENALDSVSDRDFIIEFLADIAILFTHLSRIAEDVIIFSSNEYRFIELDDAYTTGSSIMPNKKNPDMFELARGKSGRVTGNLVTLLTVMKGIPSAYNKDLQEDKEALFDSIDTAILTLPVLRDAIATATCDKARMLDACERGYITAVEIADYLAGKGLPFRDAHNVVGRIVRYAIDQGKTFQELTLDEYNAFYNGFDESIYTVVAIDEALKRKVSEGSTGPHAIAEQITKAETALTALRNA